MPDPYVVIGDAAYPSMNALLTPFKGTITHDQEIVHFRHSSQRMRVECTIGRPKGRFIRFGAASKKGDSKNFINLFHLACILHNMIEVHKLDDLGYYYELEYLNNADFTRGEFTN